MKEENFHQMMAEWCAIAWENDQRKPNLKLVKDKMNKIAKMFGVEKKFSMEQVKKVLKHGEDIASSFSKRYVIKKTKELLKLE